MKKWKLAIVGMLAVGLLAFVAGCGQNTSGGQATKDEVTGKTFIFGSEVSFAPFEYQDKATGKNVGFDIDLINAIAKEEHFTAKVKDMSFDGLIPALQTGSIDGAVSAMTITPERAKVVNFSDPYLKVDQSIAVLAGNNTIKSKDDLIGKRIAAQIGTTGYDLAKSIKDAKVSTFDHIDEAFMELQNKHVDAVVNDYPVSAYFVKIKPGIAKIVAKVPTGENYGIAVAKKNTQLLARINDGLKKIKANGEYDKIYQKWFGKGE